MLSLYRNNSCWKSSCVALLGLVCLFVLSSYNQESRIAIFRKKEIATQNDSFPKLKPHHVHRSNNDWDSVLKQLVEAGVYNSTRDFENELGVVPPYWQARRQPDDHHASKVMEWGPCYGTTTGIDWEAEIVRYGTDPRDEPRYPRAPFTSSMTKEERNFENFCRPGFLIIGAGKCGTSVS
jgi:hypothetical protein